ncbi:hypothetical protein [Demequina sp.]|uniref:hypothetical protein n=1 Tax=Demequina sp. TaxID=2050685 RepID=UPI003A8A06AF
MTEARPKPLIGGLLGLLLGALGMALMWILGVLAPDRLPLFTFLAVGTALGLALTTQRMNAARGRTLTVVVLASIMGGVALTGIPEMVRGGSLSEGCVLEATSSLEPEARTVPSTTIIDPFDVSTTDWVAWQGSLAGAASEVQVDASVLVGGIAIPVDTATLPASEDPMAWSGTLDVASVLDAISDDITLTGTFHVQAEFRSEGLLCEGDGYVRVVAPGAFDGLLLAVLWSLFALVAVALLVVALVVRRSFAAVDSQARTTPYDVGHEASLGTGSSAQEPQAVEDDRARRAAERERAAATQESPTRPEGRTSSKSADARDSSRSRSATGGGDRATTADSSAGADAPAAAEQAHDEPVAAEPEQVEPDNLEPGNLEPDNLETDAGEENSAAASALPEDDQPRPDEDPDHPRGGSI